MTSKVSDALHDKSPRLPALTGVRVILSMIVFITHAVGATAFFRSAKVSEAISSFPFAIAALSMFFVLSGFVLTWQNPWQQDKFEYARRRIAKIFPGHAVAWVVTMAILTIYGPFALVGATGWGPAIANLFLVQAWIPRPEYVLSVYGINWTVSCDILCYLMLPFLIILILRISSRYLWPCLLGLLAFVAGYPLLVSALIGGEPWSYFAPLSFDQVYASYFSPIAKIPEFFIGVFLCRIYQTGQWPRLVRGWWVVVGSIVLWVFLDSFLPRIYASSSIMVLAVCFFVPVLANRDLGSRGRFLSSRVMVILGEASYASYLVQFPLIGLVKQALGPTRQFDFWPGLFVVLGLLILNTAVGYALYRSIEKPVMSWNARSIKARRLRRREEAMPSGETGKSVSG